MHNAVSALPPEVRERAEEFFTTDLSAVRIHIGPRPSQYGAVGLVQGDDIYFLPEYLDFTTREGLALLGHELAHVVQQRHLPLMGTGAEEQVVLDDPDLEAQADLAGAVFSRLTHRNQRSPRIIPAPLCVNDTGHRGKIIQRKVWEPTRIPQPNDVFVWHATTFPSLVKLYQSDKIDIKLGDGWQGPGFYVTTQRSDYQKVMALRNNQKRSHPLMFLLYLLVEDFYWMNGIFQNDFGRPAIGADFVGVRWGGNVRGPFGKPEQTVKKPGSKLPDKYARIGGYQDEEMWTVGLKLDKPEEYDPKTWYQKAPVAGGRSPAFGSGGWRQREAQHEAVLDRLWNLAKQNDRAAGTGDANLDLLVRMIGPRKALLGTLEEITFLSERCATAIHIVGARVFSELKIELQSEFGPQSDVVTHFSPPPKGSLAYFGTSINFDNDRWVDMDSLENLIRQHLSQQ
jgi:hypothetical protein